MILNAKSLRTLSEFEAKKLRKQKKTNPVYIILDNVLDTYNIGGFFRLADAIAAEKIYLCGTCSFPPDPKIVKASVGTCQLVDWEYCPDVSEVIEKLKKNKIPVIAVEQSDNSKDFRLIEKSLPAAFLFGSESYGLKEEILKKVDFISEVPMYGFNKSLNVMIAAGVVLYEFIRNLPPRH